MFNYILNLIKELFGVGRTEDEFFRNEYEIEQLEKQYTKKDKDE